jgi:hypothetical protein
MEFGINSLKDALEVLFVPLSVALIAVLWPAAAARKRRANFERLIRRELEEAAPYPSTPDMNKLWHQHLTRRFLHEEIIRHPSDNVDFVLSLRPDLSYNLSQMWIAYDKATRDAQTVQAPSPQHAKQFCWYLEQTIKSLDRPGISDVRVRLGGTRKTDLAQRVLDPWVRIIDEKFRTRGRATSQQLLALREAIR